MRHSFPKQVRASTVRSEPDSRSYFFPTCGKIPVSYVESDFGDGVQGKGAVPLPLLSYLEAVLTARTGPNALFSSHSAAGGLIVHQLCGSARAMGFLPDCGSPSTVPRMVDVSVASRPRTQY